MATTAKSKEAPATQRSKAVMLATAKQIERDRRKLKHEHRVSQVI